MQRYTLTVQDHQTIKNAQPKPKQRRAANRCEAQNKDGQINMDTPNHMDAAAAASSKDGQPSQAHDDIEARRDPREVKFGTPAEHERDDALKAAASLQQESDATMRHTVAEIKRRRIQRGKLEGEQTKQVHQVRAIAKASNDHTSWRRDLLHLIAEYFLD